MDTAGICKEHDHKGHQDRYSVHIDRCTQRNGDTGDLVGYAHLFLHALFAERNGSRAGTGSECVQCCRQDRFQEFNRALFAYDLHRQTIYNNSKTEECRIQNDKLCCERNNGLSSVSFHNRHDGTENTDRCKVHNGCDDL